MVNVHCTHQFSGSWDKLGRGSGSALGIRKSLAWPQRQRAVPSQAPETDLKKIEHFKVTAGLSASC